MFYSTFFGIEVGKKSLIAQQLALHTTSQNVANSATVGYSRQKSVLTTTYPFNAPQMNRVELPGQLGTGVEVSNITRARDMLLEGQIRNEISGNASLESKVKYLQQVEGIIQEPSDTGLGTALDHFWNSWQELSSNPEEIANRNSVLARATQLVNTLQSKNTTLTQQQTMADQEIRTQVAQINALAGQIRDINLEINKASGVEMQPNDLMDKRDECLRQLAALTNYQSQQMGNGLCSITIGGHTLVQDGILVPLTVTNDPANNNYAQATWSDDSTPVAVSNGKLKGLLEIRDTYLPNYRTALNDLATGLMNVVNPVHAAGYALNAAAPSGEPLFTGTGLADMQVNAVLVGNPTALAAAQNVSAPGDGSNALAIAQLQNNLCMSGATQTLGAFYQNFVAQIGMDSQGATLDQSNQQSILDSLDLQQQSIAGVNMDEEMTDMIKYQDAYQAAIRMVSTMDQMLDTMINQMGLVGR